MYKLDLHVHSILSHDGGLTSADIRKVFEKKILDQIAITDHNDISYALQLKNLFGNKIIIGEEVKTDKGEIIGLFLKQRIKPGLNLEAAAESIKKQGGLIYIPHPFHYASGLGEAHMLEIISMIDIIEVFNARAVFDNINRRALLFMQKHNKIGAVGSDSHGVNGLGRSFNLVKAIVSKGIILKELKTAELVKARMALIGFLEPGLNRFKKIFK